MTLFFNPGLEITHRLITDLGGALETDAPDIEWGQLTTTVVTVAAFEATHRGIPLEAPGTRHRASPQSWLNEISADPAKWLTTLVSR